MSSNSALVMSMNNWNPSAIRYMAPKVNDRGGKSVTLISTQSNRSLYVTLPMLVTWGINDFTDSTTGESDGKYTISLQFPRDQDCNEETDEALRKMKEFEDKLLNDAVKNAEVWFGKKKSREVVEDGYYSFLKYGKNKETGEIDTSKAPTIRPKVPCYDGKWKVEVYDTQGDLLFPCPDNDTATPMDFVPKRSNVMSIIQCGGVWVGGKGWGLTWKLTQCVVKPMVMEYVLGGLRLNITSEQSDAISKDIPKGSEEQVITEEDEKKVPVNTYVQDSDDDEVAESVVKEEVVVAVKEEVVVAVKEEVVVAVKEEVVVAVKEEVVVAVKEEVVVAVKEEVAKTPVVKKKIVKKKTVP